MDISIKKLMYLAVAAWLFMPVIAHAQWILVYSAEDKFCQHLLVRINEHLEEWVPDPTKFPEVQAIEWTSDHQIMGPDGNPPRVDSLRDNRVAIVDVNNDGIDEIARIWEVYAAEGGQVEVFPASSTLILL